MRLRALVEQIDRNLAIYRFRRGVTLERLGTSMAMLNGIDVCVDELLEERSRAAAMDHPGTVVELIDSHLADYVSCRTVMLDRLISSMGMLNAIDHRVDELRGQRSRALSMAAHPSAGA